MLTFTPSMNNMYNYHCVCHFQPITYLYVDLKAEKS